LTALRSSFESASEPPPDLNAPALGAGSLSGFAALGAGVVATAITTPVVVHALGPAMFGLWVSLIAAVSFTGLLDFGFAQAVARFTGESRARGDMEAMGDFIVTMAGAYSVVFALVLTATLVIGLAFPTFVKLPPGAHGFVLPAAFLVGLATGLGLWMGFLGSILHAHQRLPLANAARALYWTLFLALTVGAALLGWGINGLAAAMSVSALVACGVQLAAVRRLLPMLRLRPPQGRSLRQGLRYSVFMFMISAGAAVVFDTDTLVIAGFKGVAAVTAYAITLRVTRGLTLFLHRVPDVMFPFYAGMRAVGDQARIRENFLLTARLEMAGAIMLVLGLSFAGAPLVAAWVGPSNVASLPVFMLAISLVVMEAIVHPGAVLAAATGGERQMALANNAEAVINLGLSIILVIRFGVAGVIGATVLAQAMTNLWFLPRWAMQRLAISVPEYLAATAGRALMPALCGAIGGLVVTHWAASTPGACIAAAVAMGLFGLVYLRGGAGPEERKWVRGWLGQRRVA
jgi:O-antigen/teichoic acid export membrane protein